jgi:hypothetical protein
MLVGKTVISDGAIRVKQDKLSFQRAVYYPEVGI